MLPTWMALTMDVMSRLGGMGFFYLTSPQTPLRYRFLRVDIAVGWRGAFKGLRLVGLNYPSKTSESDEPL